MTNSLATVISSLIEAINRRDFDAIEAMLDDDCVLDLPGGSRVIGRESVRNSLSAYTLRRDVQLADTVVMTDASRQRGAAEVTLRSGGTAAAAVLIFERDNDMLSRISLFSAT